MWPAYRCRHLKQPLCSYNRSHSSSVRGGSIERGQLYLFGAHIVLRLSVFVLVLTLVFTTREGPVRFHFFFSSFSSSKATRFALCLTALAILISVSLIAFSHFWNSSALSAASSVAFSSSFSHRSSVMLLKICSLSHSSVK